MPELTRKISVIIPAYNVKDLVVKCLDSIVSQDYPSELMQIIAVDDGSTDGTAEVLDDYAIKHPQVTVLHKKNGGSSSARNLGIRNATGDYLGFVDADDYISPDMYRLLVSAALEHDAAMVQISRDEIAENGKKLPDVVIPPSGITEISAREHLRTLLMHTGDASFCTKITKRELFTDEFLFPEGELNEDFHLMIRMMTRIDKLVIRPEQGYHVFYRLGSNSRKRAEDKDYFPSVFTDIVRNSDVVLELVRHNFSDLTEVAERFGYVQRLDYLLHIPVSLMKKDNAFYSEVVKNIRRNLFKIASNRYLSSKQKAYLWLLAPAPRTVRALHAKIRGL